MTEVFHGEADAEFGGAVDEELMEGGAANSYALAGGEIGCDAGQVRGEGDAFEFGSMAGLDLNAELGESLAGVGHEAFTAGFVDGGWRASARRTSAPP